MRTRDFHGPQQQDGGITPHRIAKGNEMVVKLKKISEARQSYGRGTDSRRTPAAWEVLDDGKTIGFVRGESVGFMGCANWKAIAADGRLIRTHYSTRAAAVARVVQNAAA